MSAPWEALALGLCVVAGILGTGLRITDRWKIGASRLERWVWTLALGLAALAYVVLAVGSAGWLRKEVFLIGLVLLLSVGLRRLAGEFKAGAAAASSAWGGASWFERSLVIPASTCLFFSLAAALAPAVGQDELCYHLVQPQNYVRAGEIYAVPYSVNALWPYLSHMLFTLGLLIQGAEAAKLFHWIFYVLTAAAVGSFARRFVSGKAGWIAAVCYLATPAAFAQAGYAYIDHALALYVFLAFYAACAWAQRLSSGWAWLAGIACGLAASVKLIGLFSLFPVAAIACIWAHKAGQPRAFWIGAFRIAVGAVAAGCVWYIRSWILTGNPVYPFYPGIFGGNGFEDLTYVDSHGRGSGLWAFFLLPWDVTMHPDWFGGELTGPLFLACAPLILLWACRTPAAKWTAVALLAYAAPWFKVDPNIRFFYAVFAWSAVLCGIAAASWIRETAHAAPRRVLTGLFLFLILLQSAFAPYYFADEARLWITGGDRRAYLDANERSSRTAREANRFLGVDAWILSAGEVRGFYFDQRFTLAGDFERMTPAADRPKDAAAYARYLRSLGFTHVLLSDLEAGQGTATETERIVAERAASRKYFKDELVVRSQGRSYVIYRIL